MMALSIRQPWAWMILHAGKDIENRTWRTGFRGRVLIHAAKGMTRDEWAPAWAFAEWSGAHHEAFARNVRFDTIERGVIIGSVEIVDRVRESNSRWFCGAWGFVLRNPEPLPFRACRGALGFFDVDQ